MSELDILLTNRFAHLLPEISCSFVIYPVS
jgi:hypothetical protein